MKKYKLVNWQGQMRMSALHFQQTENYFTEELNEVRSLFLRKYEYGLLPLPEDGKEAEIQIREQASNQIEVRLYSCDAVTSSGERIHFNLSKSDTPLSKTFFPQQEKQEQDKENSLWDVILSVDPYERVAVGELNPLEDPPRHPDCESQYKLHVVPMGEFNLSTFGSHFLIIGRIRKSGGRYLPDQNYIPPCRAMSSHSELLQYCKRFDSRLYGLSTTSRNIIGKVNNKPNGSELAANIRLMSDAIYTYISSIHFRLKNFGTDIPPVLMTEYISSLASHCHACLIRLPGVQKDELLKYFYEWSDVTPGALESLLSSTMEMIYTHTNLRAVMVQLESFIATFCDLWEHLNRLEYIGQHKESLVVSASGGGRNEDKRGFMVSD